MTEPEFTDEKIAEHVARAVRDAPPLTEDQLRRISRILAAGLRDRETERRDQPGDCGQVPANRRH